mmetsp:Transcript_20041/g.64028  ORF Transcript_20041/g.64028 Transcript_20041/m.64028 type:complete len:275 (-) Transcript_20041:990-1814(-)
MHSHHDGSWRREAGPDVLEGPAAICRLCDANLEARHEDSRVGCKVGGEDHIVRHRENLLGAAAVEALVAQRALRERHRHVEPMFAAVCRADEPLRANVEERAVAVVRRRVPHDVVPPRLAAGAQPPERGLAPGPRVAELGQLNVAVHAAALVQARGHGEVRGAERARRDGDALDERQHQVELRPRASPVAAAENPLKRAEEEVRDAGDNLREAHPPARLGLQPRIVQPVVVANLPPGRTTRERALGGDRKRAPLQKQHQLVVDVDELAVGARAD